LKKNPGYIASIEPLIVVNLVQGNENYETWKTHSPDPFPSEASPFLAIDGVRKGKNMWRSFATHFCDLQRLHLHRRSR